jgi:hypothetical protein
MMSWLRLHAWSAFHGVGSIWSVYKSERLVYIKILLFIHLLLSLHTCHFVSRLGNTKVASDLNAAHEPLNTSALRPAQVRKVEQGIRNCQSRQQKQEPRMTIPFCCAINVTAHSKEILVCLSGCSTFFYQANNKNPCARPIMQLKK